ncbi:hypothetical protein [Marinigracilibium pacificum]|uniref:Uncharacterized protein n=1 Tax=Marinigracilibium pacificum TaxID=2729599 RepID=A0A848IWX1_9BACT|nr:hypothetical protein [Marinigracilibium pacificum]NMM48817.1 hypothetical protein [Marinigracilibium pacificum]
MDFSTFLKTKRIDPDSLKKTDPSLYHSWELLYGYVHPNSFVRQKLFVINKIRRMHPFEGEIPKPELKPKPSVKPAIAAKAVRGKAIIKPKVKAPDDISDTKEVKAVKPKPVRVKPVIKASKAEDQPEPSVPKAIKKPRPVIRPKMATDKESTENTVEQKSKPIKPKMKRPVIKKKSEDTEQEKKVEPINESVNTEKKKAPRPIMKKPKINRPNKDENDV